MTNQIRVLAKIKSKMYKMTGSIFMVPQTDDQLYWLTHLARTSPYEVITEHVAYRDFPVCSVVSLAIPPGGPRAFALAEMESETESEVERLRAENQQLRRDTLALYAEIDRLRRARDTGGFDNTR